MPFQKEQVFNRKNVTDIELSYLAGLIDGEGSFQIRRHHRSGSAYTYYYPRLVIKMKRGNWESIVAKMNIGNFYYNQSRNRNQTAWYLYRANDLDAFLEIIIPFLRVKKEQATSLLEWIRISDTKTPPKEEWNNPYDW